MSTYGQHLLEDLGPGRLPRFGIRVGQGHVARGRRAGVFGRLEGALQLLALIGVHPPHEGRGAEMKDAALSDEVDVQVLGAILVVRAGVMQDNAVDARRGDHDRVRAHATGHHVDAIRVPALLQEVEREFAEGVVADARAETHGVAQAAQGDAGIRHRAAGADLSGAQDHQFARPQHLADGGGAGLGKPWNDIDAHVRGHHHVIGSTDRPSFPYSSVKSCCIGTLGATGLPGIR